MIVTDAGINNSPFFGLIRPGWEEVWSEVRWEEVWWDDSVGNDKSSWILRSSPDEVSGGKRGPSGVLSNAASFSVLGMTPLVGLDLDAMRFISSDWENMSCKHSISKDSSRRFPPSMVGVQFASNPSFWQNNRRRQARHSATCPPPIHWITFYYP